MSFLNQSHLCALYNARQILKNIDRSNPHSRHHAQRVNTLKKLRQMHEVIRLLIKEPDFSQLSNLDTGGELKNRSRLGVEHYCRKELIHDGNPNAG